MGALLCRTVCILLLATDSAASFRADSAATHSLVPPGDSWTPALESSHWQVSMSVRI